MEFLGMALLAGSGMYLNSLEKDKIPPKKVKLNMRLKREQPIIEVEEQKPKSKLDNEKEAARNTFKVQFFKKKEISNPNFVESSLWEDFDQKELDQIKKRVDITKKYDDPKINDVGFESHNIEGSDLYSSNEMIPSIDDMDRDIQLIHNNMVPFFGSTVKQNINETGFTQAVLENYTGNFRHTRRDNKVEVEYLFDPTPNNQQVYGSSTEMTTNRDQSRFFPSATGKKHNELPFEQIQVGKGIANGYTARPSGGFHQDVRILPKTTEELQVNPKITYEGRILSGKHPTEKGRLMSGEMQLKKPKAIVWNWNGERNFTGQAAHRKNKQRPDIIFKFTNKDKLHREYRGNAQPTNKSQSIPESLRGKKRISHKRNFENTPFRNATQAEGKRMNDFSKSGFENRETERSMQSTRTHYTNVTGVGAKGNQQRSFNQNGLRYTRKQELIANRPGSDCGVVGGKAGPTNFKQGGRVYDPTQTAKTTIRETMEESRHDGWVGNHQYRGKVYDTNESAKTTVRETTENNRHHGFVGKHELKGKVYDPTQTAKTTIRETTENNRRHGNLARFQKKGMVYDPNQTAKTTVRETTENNRHHGFIGKHELKGKVYNRDETAKTTIRETTEVNRHNGNMGYHTMKGKVYDETETAKPTIRETTENNRHIGFVGKTKLKGKAYNQSEVARKTIRETTEDNKYVPSVNATRLQNGTGYMTTKYEMRNPQKAYLCNHEYVGGGEATSNKKPRSYNAEYRVNTNKEQIAVGRAPNEVKNPINVGKEGYNICINKLEADIETPHLFGKGTSIGNMYNPKSITRCSLTTRKNTTPTQIDRLQLDTLDAVKNNPLMVNQNLN